MHAHKGVRHLVAAAPVAGLVTTSLSEISTQAVGASPPGNGESVSQIITNVRDCLNGGCVNYSTTSGKSFQTPVGCVIYALFGGTLMALPDLVVIPSCTSAPGSESCSFSVENTGLGAATGNLVLEATVTAPQTISSPGYNDSADCASQNVATGNAVPTGVTAIASCTGTFPPGTTTPIPLSVQVFGGAASGQSLTITAVVNPNHTIAESNYANDSFARRSSSLSRRFWNRSDRLSTRSWLTVSSDVRIGQREGPQ